MGWGINKGTPKREKQPLLPQAKLKKERTDRAARQASADARKRAAGKNW